MGIPDSVAFGSFPQLTNRAVFMNRPGFAGDSRLCELGVIRKSKQYSPETRERAVRMVLERRRHYPSQWAAIRSIAEKIGCTAETLRLWVRRAEGHQGSTNAASTDEQARIKDLERENRELRRGSEILRLASAYFAQAELDRQPK